MFDIGFWELALIGVVALLVVGPERLPRMAREVGMWTGKVRRYVQHVRDDIEREIRAEELKEMMHQPEALGGLEEVVGETRETLAQARSELATAEHELGDEAATSTSQPTPGDAEPGTSQPTPGDAEPGISQPTPGDAEPGGAPALDGAATGGPAEPAGEELISPASRMFQQAAPQPAEAPPATASDERGT